MKADYLHDYDYVLEEILEDEEILFLFPSESEAIFALYEQLFCNLNSVCKDTILNAMKYLIFSKNMDEQMEEIRHMTTDEVDVVHHREVDKSVDETTKEFKDKLYSILEDKLF